MNKRESDEHFQRGLWDAVHADRLMSIIKYGLRNDVWREDLMEAHLHLVWYDAHAQNIARDFQRRHGLTVVRKEAVVCTTTA